MLRLIAFAVLAVFLHSVSKAAEPTIFGAHWYTYHVPEEVNCKACSVSNNTPGLYIIHAGYTVGAVRNSYQRWSVYGGKMWSQDGFDFTLGVITGYKYRLIEGPDSCPNMVPEERRNSTTCSVRMGTTNAVLRPLVAVSYAIPLQQYIGTSPRLTVLGKGLHLSLEWLQ
jgi:hypothetical protein